MRIAGKLDRLSPEENSPRNITQGLAIPRDPSPYLVILSGKLRQFASRSALKSRYLT